MGRFGFGILALGVTLGCVTLAGARPDATAAGRAAITGYARLLMVEHKPELAFARYYAPHLMQHDPLIGDGGNGDDSFLKARRKAHPKQYQSADKYANVIHTILADRDLVAIVSHVFTNPNDTGRMFVDIWRIENGRFAEHWDVIQPLAVGQARATGCGVGGTYAAARALGDTAAKPACGMPDQRVDSAASRRTVLAYMALGQQPGRIADAVNAYLAPDFIQHSAHIAPGRKGLIDYLTAHDAARRADHRTSHIARTLADGNMVLVHRLVTSARNPRGTAYADLFRLRGGKIAEHWDVVQPVPDFSVSGRSMVDGPLEPGRHKGAPDQTK